MNVVEVRRSLADEAAVSLVRAWLRGAIADHRLPWYSHARGAFLARLCWGVRIGSHDADEVLNHFLILPEPFCLHACRGHDYEAVCLALRRAGYMKGLRPVGYSTISRLPLIGHTSVYRISGAILDS